MEKYDVVIVGAGPAGATLARLLDKGFKVLVIEKRPVYRVEDRAKPYDKCCGGLVAPDAQSMLARLGLGLPKEVLAGPQLFAVHSMDLDSGIERHYLRDYINVDRGALDEWMLSLVPENVRICRRAVFKGFQEKGEEVLIDYEQDGVKHTVSSRLLVGADGASSILRRRFFPGGEKRYVAIQEWFKTVDPSPFYGSIFDGEITDFYCWTIPKEGELIVGAAIPEGQDVNGNFQLLKDKLMAKGFELGTRTKRSGAFIIRPRAGKQIATGEGRVFLVGEAAGFISPSSAEGLSYGMKSGLALARAINRYGESLGHDPTGIMKSYVRNTGSLRWNILWKNLKAPAMYTPWLRGLIMKSRVLSTRIIERR